jgi:hypothetical protein
MLARVSHMRKSESDTTTSRPMRCPSCRQLASWPASILLISCTVATPTSRTYQSAPGLTGTTPCFDVSLPTLRAYGPAEREHGCGMGWRIPVTTNAGKHVRGSRRDRPSRRSVVRTRSRSSWRAGGLRAGCAGRASVGAGLDHAVAKRADRAGGGPGNARRLADDGITLGGCDDGHIAHGSPRTDPRPASRPP